MQMTGVNPREIVVARSFRVQPVVLWAAYGDAAGIGQWWGPWGFSTSTHSMDFRLGGEWRFTMHGPDGTDYENRVVYITLDAPALLAYDHYGQGDTTEPHLRAQVSFEARGGETLVTLRMVFPSAQLRESALQFGVVEGGEQTLARLALQLGEE